MSVTVAQNARGTSPTSSHLGPLVGKYGPNPARRVTGVGSAALSLIFAGIFVGVGLANISVREAPTVTIIAGMLALGCVALATYRGWTVYASRGAWIELYAEGFTVSRAGAIVTARWDDIASLRERLFYVPLRARAIRTSYHITLANGQVARIDHALDQISELGKALQRMTTAALLPVARDAYERGEPVRFGRFSVTQWGIIDHDHDHKQENDVDGRAQTLLWRDLRRISFAHGVLTISRGDLRRPWARARVADIPNIYLLTTLISYIPRS